MAIEYSDPETRNLSITSMAFIIYYLAGGSFSSDEISFQVVNVHFSKPEVLALIAWLMLFWFLYRYWVTHKGEYAERYWKEINDYKNHPAVRGYLTNNLVKGVLVPEQLSVSAKAHDTEEGWIISHLGKQDGKLTIFADFADAIERNKYGFIEKANHPGVVKKLSAHTRGDIVNTNVTLKGYSGNLALIRINLRFLLEYRTFSDYLIPYFLFIIATLSACTSWVSSFTPI